MGSSTESPESPAPTGEETPTAAMPSDGVAGAPDADVFPLRLTPELRRLLGRHCPPDGWHPEGLIAEILRTQLAAHRPAIWYGGRQLAREGTYRTLSRHPLETNLRLATESGEFVFQAVSAHAETAHWLRHFELLGAEKPERLARQMRVYQLQQHLSAVDDYDPQGWRKEIPVDAYRLLFLSAVEEPT